VSDGAAALSWGQVSARRMQRHGLGSARFGHPADAVAAMGAAHAQVPSAAELSIGLRLTAGTRADVRDALWRDRSLVRTFGPRGTVHLLPTAELPMWTGALSALPVSTSMPNDVRLTAPQTDTVVDAIADALDDAELTIDELSAAVVARAGPWAGDLVMPAFQELWPRWRQALTTAAHRGAMCFGPNRGRNVTYTNPHRWLPGFQPIAGPTALAELLRRYLYAYGPASSAHFARWLGCPAKLAADLFDARADELEPVDVAGAIGWVRAGDTAAPEDAPPSVRLLPYFDSYVVGGQPRELLYPGRAAERALNRGQAGNFPVLLVDGTVAGVWHQRRAGARIDVTVEPLTKLRTARRRALEEQVDRIGVILEAKPTLTIGPVTVGAHA
jgi:uncharacterized protein YukE